MFAMLQPENIVLVRPPGTRIVPGERIVVKLVDLGFTRHRQVDGMTSYRGTEVPICEQQHCDCPRVE
jgi:hypothetical protein